MTCTELDPFACARVQAVCMPKLRSTAFLGPPEPDPNRPLARAAAAGDADALDTLLGTVLPPMLRVVRQVLGAAHSDAEDVLQEASVGLVEALPTFRHECTVLHFACRVALLTALNTRRRFQLRERLTPSAAPLDLDDVPGDPRVQTDVLAERRRAVLLGLLDDLPQPQAETLALHCVLGYTVEETARATSVPPNTVRGRLVSAKASLREALALDSELEEQLRAWSRGAS